MPIEPNLDSDNNDSSTYTVPPTPQMNFSLFVP